MSVNDKGQKYQEFCDIVSGKIRKYTFKEGIVSHSCHRLGCDYIFGNSFNDKKKDLDFKTTNPVMIHLKNVKTEKNKP